MKRWLRMDLSWRGVDCMKKSSLLVLISIVLLLLSSCLLPEITTTTVSYLVHTHSSNPTGGQLTNPWVNEDVALTATSTNLNLAVTNSHAKNTDNILKQSAGGADLINNATLKSNLAVDPGITIDGVDVSAHTHGAGAHGGQLISPLVNENVAMTVTSTNLNLVDDNDRFYQLYKKNSYIYPTNAGWFVTTTGSCTVSQTPSRLATYTGATAASSATTQTYPMGLSTETQWINFGSPFSFYGRLAIEHANPSTQESWVHFQHTNTPAIGDLVVKGLGINWKYVDAASPIRIYICSHDGATYSELDTGINAITGSTGIYEIIWTPATNIKVYLGGVLIGTKVNNLPTGDANSSFGIQHQRTAGTAGAWDGIRLSFPILYGIL